MDFSSCKMTPQQQQQQQQQNNSVLNDGLVDNNATSTTHQHQRAKRKKNRFFDCAKTFFLPFLIFSFWQFNFFVCEQQSNEQNKVWQLTEKKIIYNFHL